MRQKFVFFCLRAAMQEKRRIKEINIEIIRNNVKYLRHKNSCNQDIITEVQKGEHDDDERANIKTHSGCTLMA